MTELMYECVVSVLFRSICAECCVCFVPEQLDRCVVPVLWLSIWTNVLCLWCDRAYVQMFCVCVVTKHLYKCVLWRSSCTDVLGLCCDEAAVQMCWACVVTKQLYKCVRSVLWRKSCANMLCLCCDGTAVQMCYVCARCEGVSVQMCCIYVEYL